VDQLLQEHGRFLASVSQAGIRLLVTVYRKDNLDLSREPRADGSRKASAQVWEVIKFFPSSIYQNL
jgi:hypothetical protein